jgi:hypothetical protein
VNNETIKLHKMINRPDGYQDRHTAVIEVGETHVNHYVFNQDGVPVSGYLSGILLIDDNADQVKAMTVNWYLENGFETERESVKFKGLHNE